MEGPQAAPARPRSGTAGPGGAGRGGAKRGAGAALPPGAGRGADTVPLAAGASGATPRPTVATPRAGAAGASVTSVLMAAGGDRGARPVLPSPHVWKDPSFGPPGLPKRGVRLCCRATILHLPFASASASCFPSIKMGLVPQGAIPDWRVCCAHICES